MTQSASVLIVEDNYLLLEMLSSLCEQQGIRVFAASSGEDALTMLRQRASEIDWLFTDISLPGLIDGWEVAAAYREQNPRRPVIYASTAPHIARRTVPGSIFVHKPFQVREIISLAKMMVLAEGEESLLSAAG
ncbi:response regulator [Methylobacterium gnaphalii]|uniref:Response regulator n=1 Tax=Methylobacterium gnaphalii TaxID=1010610 RepID=A0A512JFW3_9HYPH|nr:response regulator [Methylobacterium gnaphalii]GEP08828.1 response regulator [Methylobacterium gnaphalii]GJD69769.1 putative transcriptional regulatory protein TcrX [Methylobacterium gnaphalii]GLS47593.1 response regulator [Methylobacterium gnaphalii]